jgi:LysM repeat protein
MAERLLSRLFNTARLFGVVAGIPLVLVRYVGWCLPRHVNVVDVRNAWSMGDIDPTTVVKAFACALWIAWALVMVSLSMHLASKVLHTKLRRPAFVPKRVFAITGRWLGGVTLAATTTVMSMNGSAMAASTKPLTTVSTMMNASPTSPVDTSSTAKSSTVSQANGGAASSAGSWTVKPGDTLWEIAETTLGDGTLWRVIAEANPTVNDELPVGTVLVIPGTTSSSQSEAQRVTTDAVVTVRNGDHFWKISEEVLSEAYGRPATDAEITPYWRDVVELNRDDVPSGNVNLIHTGEHYRVQLPELPADVTGSHRVTRLDTPVEISSEAPAESKVGGGASIAASFGVAPPAFVSSVPELASPVASAPVTSVPVTSVAEATIPTTVSVIAPTVLAEQAVAPEFVTASSGSETSRRGKQGVAITLMGVTTMLAAAGLWRLKRRRNADMVARKTGDPVVVPTAAAKRLERTYRSIAEADQVEWLEEALCAVQANLADLTDQPRVVAMRAGMHGVEVVFDRAVGPKAPFEATNIDTPGDMHAWRLAPNVDYEDLRAVGDNWHGLVPFLVSPGDTDDGPIFIGLDGVERVGVFCQQPEIATATVKAIALQAAMLPWGEERQLVIVGADEPTKAVFVFDHVRFVEHLSEVAPSLLSGALTNVVLLTPPDMKAVVELETQFQKQLTLIGVGLGGGIELAVDASTRSGHIEPFGIRLSHVAIAGPIQVEGLTRLLDTTNETATSPMGDVHAAGSTWDDLEESQPATAHSDEFENDDDWEPNEPFDDGPTANEFASAEVAHNEEHSDVEDGIANNEQSSSVDWATMWKSGSRPATNVEPVIDAGEDFPDDDNDPDGGPGKGSAIPTNNDDGEDFDGLDAGQVGDDDSELVGATLSADLMQWLDEVMAPRDIEVSVLGDEPTVRLDTVRLSQAKIEEFIVLAAIGPIGRDSVQVALSDVEMTRNAIRQLLYRARKVVGDDALLAGKNEIAINPMRVGMDWTRFEKLVERATELKADFPNDAVVCLQRALQLPTGIGWRVLRGGGYEWAYERQLPYAMATAINDAACMLGQLAVEVLAQPRMAIWATGRGMLATTAPSLELVEWGLRGAVAAGDVSEVARFEKVLDSLAAEYDVELAPSTQALLAHIRRHVDGRRSVAAV